jgi:hypothetical protein
MTESETQIDMIMIFSTRHHNLIGGLELVHNAINNYCDTALSQLILLEMAPICSTVGRIVVIIKLPNDHFKLLQLDFFLVAGAVTVLVGTG